MARLYAREDVQDVLRSRSVVAPRNGKSDRIMEVGCDQDDFDDYLPAQALVRRLEGRVVRILQLLATTVVQTELPQQQNQQKQQYIRDEPTFLRFCDAAVLSLWVDLVLASPHDPALLHGLVWSAVIKAQVLRSIHFLVLAGDLTTSLVSQQHGL